MKLHRFYTTEIGILKDPDLVHQLLNVLRFKSGQEIILFNGDGFNYNVVLKNIVDGHLPRNKKIEIEIKNKIENKIKQKREIILFQSLIKKDNFELIVEKVTELGVSKIVPIISERSEKKGINMQRVNKIATEATEQSGRNNVPRITGIVSLSDCLQNLSISATCFHPQGKPFHDGNMSRVLLGNSSLAIFIGPEGGWTDQEIEMFKENRVEILSLGDGILRSETAAISALALLSL